MAYFLGYPEYFMVVFINEQSAVTADIYILVMIKYFRLRKKEQTTFKQIPGWHD